MKRSRRARTNWRNMPPKKMILASRLHTRLSEEEFFRLVFRGLVDEISGHSIKKRGDSYEHVYTVKQEDELTWITVVNEAVPEERHYTALMPPEPTLRFEIEETNLSVSFALYNQLIVREPEGHNIGFGSPV